MFAPSAEGARQVQLTDAEWLSLLVNSEKGALPPCCANISNLRSAIASLVHANGETTIYTGDDRVIPTMWARGVLATYGIAADGHDFTEQDFPVLRYLIRQLEEQTGLTSEQAKTEDGEIYDDLAWDGMEFIGDPLEMTILADGGKVLARDATSAGFSSWARRWSQAFADMPGGWSRLERKAFVRFLRDTHLIKDSRLKK